VRPGHVRAEAGTGGERPKQRQRLGFPLDGYLGQRLVLEHPARRAIRLFADRNTVHRRRALDASGRVDNVARHDPLPLLGSRADGDDRLARVNPHPHLQLKIGTGLIQIRDRFQDCEPRPHRPLGVVLVRHRSAAHGHDRVADELLDRAAVPLDLLPHTRVVRTDSRAHVLWVLLFRGGGEADQVAEQDAHELPLLARRRRCSLRERRGALVAKFRPLGVLRAAARADHTAESRTLA
jgi:hypothetical protein